MSPPRQWRERQFSRRLCSHRHIDLCEGRRLDGIYVNNQLNYVVNGAKLNTSVTLNPGSYDTVVQSGITAAGARTSTLNHS